MPATARRTARAAMEDAGSHGTRWTPGHATSPQVTHKKSRKLFEELQELKSHHVRLSGGIGVVALPASPCK